MNADGSKWCVRQDFLWPPVTENFCKKNLQRDGTDSPLGTTQEIARDPGSFYVVPCGLSVSGHQAACRAYRSHDKCPSEKKKEQMPTINNTYVLLGTRVSWTLLATEKSGKSDGFHNFRNKEEDWTQWSDWLNDSHYKQCTFKAEHTLNSQKETHALEVI